MIHQTVEIVEQQKHDLVLEKPDVREQHELLYKKTESSKSLALSHTSDYDYGLSPSVSIQDLEEMNPYEVHWHVGADYVPTYVVANFERKIMNYDPRSEECTDVDLVFQHLKTGNSFTIHSDLVDEGVVEFYMLSDE